VPDQSLEVFFLEEIPKISTNWCVKKATAGISNMHYGGRMQAAIMVCVALGY
jgi:hypothetical protein